MEKWLRSCYHKWLQPLAWWLQWWLMNILEVIPGEEPQRRKLWAWNGRQVDGDYNDHEKRATVTMSICQGSNMVGRSCQNWLRWFQTGAWFHPLVPWIKNHWPKHSFELLEYLFAWTVLVLSYHGYPWVWFRHWCGRSVATLESPGVCSWLRTLTLRDFHTWSISGLSWFWMYDVFCSSDVECLQNCTYLQPELKIFECNCKQSTLQHWWPAGNSQEHPGVALSTSYGHICSQPQLGNEGVPGVNYGHGTGLSTKLRRTSPVCRREVSTSPWMELGCQGIGHCVLFASAICCNDISASFILPV